MPPYSLGYHHPGSVRAGRIRLASSPVSTVLCCRIGAAPYCQVVPCLHAALLCCNGPRPHDLPEMAWTRDAVLYCFRPCVDSPFQPQWGSILLLVRALPQYSTPLFYWASCFVSLAMWLSHLPGVYLVCQMDRQIDGSIGRWIDREIGR